MQKIAPFAIPSNRTEPPCQSRPDLDGFGVLLAGDDLPGVRQHQVVVVVGGKLILGQLPLHRIGAGMTHWPERCRVERQSKGQAPVVLLGGLDLPPIVGPVVQ